MRTLLGRGILNWNRDERISDRYGTVGLWGEGSKIEFLGAIMGPRGRKGKLVAVVVEARDSSHIGDLFHGFSPTTPNIREEITLGDGTLFFGEDQTTVGLRPDDGRKAFWLTPQALYRAHEQTVDLFFVEEDAATDPAGSEGHVL